MQTLPKNRSRGIALIVVLVFLVILSVFIVGFFSNSQDEMVAAQSFTGEASAQQLGDMAVSVVMGQIREATSRAAGMRANRKYGNGAWGSQPGMIRVYADGDKASGKADAFFKLYSSDDMVLTGREIEAFNPNTEVPTGAGIGWNHLPAQWTNLNQKVTVPPPPGSTDKAVDHYPILDPFIGDKKAYKPEGLEFAGVDFPKTDSDDTRDPVRMPVKWLYVLRDGTLTAPSSTEADGTRARWVAGQRAPKANNPIVGRIAFWTDDESCKVNINTAGGFSTTPDNSTNGGTSGGRPTAYSEDDYAGSFWDTPRTMTEFDRGVLGPNGGKVIKGGLAVTQPVRGEFQRYPGHPATTSLGLVFKNNKDAASSPNISWLTSGQLALLTPRLQYSLEAGTDDDSWPVIRRGSNYGTYRVLSKPDPDDPMKISTPPDLRVKRLYASVDEMFFAQPDPTTTTTKRVLNDTELKLTSGSGDPAVLTPSLLESLRFFLTANSRAPELNLYGRPRMTIWPVFNVLGVDDENDLWNASDRLLAFCSTVGPTTAKDSNVDESTVKRFLFQRTPAGRNGKPSGATSSTLEMENERNQTLYRTISSMTDLPFPGFGQSFGNKYKNERNQILTEMFDYIRCVNLRDSTRDKLINTNYKGVFNIKQKEKYKYAPRGLVVPLQYNGTSGFGRFPTISEAALVFYVSGYVGEDNLRYIQRDPAKIANVLPLGAASGTSTVKVKSNLVRAFLLFETFNPMQGYAPTATPDANWYDQSPIVFELEFQQPLTINGDPMSLPFPTKATNEFKYASGSMYGGRNSGGSEGFMHTLFEKRNPAPEVTAGSAPNNYAYKPAFGPDPYASGTGYTPTYQFQTTPDDKKVPGFPVPTTGTMSLSSARAVLTISFKGDTAKRTIALNFPSATVPVPTDEIWTTSNLAAASGFVLTNNSLNGADFVGSGKAKVDPKAVRSFNGRLNWVQNNDSTNYNLTTSGGVTPSANTPGANYANRWHQMLQPGDVVRSLQFGTKDIRISCITDDATVFQPNPSYTDSTVMHAQTLRMADSNLYYPYNNETKFGNIAELPTGRAYPPKEAADIPSNINGVRRTDGHLGDFDTGIGNLADGPFCGKADEGNLAYKFEIFDMYGKSFTPKQFSYPTPYFTWQYEEAFDTFFTPNRQVPSPVAFGSLLAGRQASWQTLCFCPNPPGINHPGRVIPKDYLWLDLFTMPVVEPYAISEPFSTAGKVNLNYPLIPFPHIKRTTALRAVLQSERVTAFPISDVVPGTSNPQLMSFKTGSSLSTTIPLTKNYRALVDRNETLKAFDAFFDVYNGGTADPSKDDGSPSNHSKGFFKSAAQICDFYLYPSVNGKPLYSWSTDETEIKQFWALNPLTGDNVREKPYSDLYPRLTTKSNTYCVHVRAQALRQSAAADAASSADHYRTWDENRDRVIGEYRGSTIIERYIDPDDARFDPKLSGRGNTGDTYLDIDKYPLEDVYRFRVLNTKRFSP